MSRPHKHYILPVDNPVDNSPSYPQVKDGMKFKKVIHRVIHKLSTTNLGKCLSKKVIHILSTGYPQANLWITIENFVENNL